MKTIIYSAILLFLFSCNSNTSESTANEQQKFANNDEIVNSVKGANGKYFLDQTTVGNIHRFENTVLNFRDISKKRSPKIDIYNEFSIIISRNVEEISSQCKMNGEGHELLKNILNKISEQNKTISGTDLEQAKLAFKNICNLTDQINSDFDYSN